MLWQCCAKDLVGFSLRNILVRERLWFGCRDHGLVSMKPKLTVIRLQEIISDIQCYSQTFCFWPFQPPWCRLCGSIMMSSSFLFHDPQTRLIIHTRWLSSWNINIFCFGAFSETTNAVVSLGRTVSKETVCFCSEYGWWAWWGWTTVKLDKTKPLAKTPRMLLELNEMFSLVSVAHFKLHTDL